MYSKLMILGRCTTPELRYTPQGTAVATFSVAPSSKYKSGEEWKEQTTWFRVTVCGKQSEAVNQYLTKGSKVFVEGTLTPDESGSPKIWTDKEGKPRASFEVRADVVKFLDSKSDKKEEKSGETELPF
jgi:single-strand DNA-binding protein